MKINPNTRNIFTKQGRLNRLIDKHNKNVQLLDKMNKILDRLTSKYDSEVPLDEINKEVYGTNTESEECVIRCDGCSHEFNIYDKNIEIIEVDKTTENGEYFVVDMYVCPECGFKNEIDEDENEEDITEEIELLENLETSSNEKDNQSESIQISTDDDKPCISKINDRKIIIKNKTNDKHHKVIIKSKPIKYIQDKKIIDSIKIAMNNKSRSETLSMFKDVGIDFKMTEEDVVATYFLNNGNISFMCNKENKESIEAFIINTKLMLVPHGNHINIYNNILSQLGIEKVDNKFESVELGGKACIIKLNDGNMAACNFRITDNDLVMTIIYNVD